MITIVYAEFIDQTTTALTVLPFTIRTAPSGRPRVIGLIPTDLFASVVLVTMTQSQLEGKFVVEEIRYLSRWLTLTPY